METLTAAEVGPDYGIFGDSRGKRRANGDDRFQVTLVAHEDWQAALAEIGESVDWTTRRANLLVEGVALPHCAGVRIRIGPDVLLETTMETDPCSRMDEASPGLRAALTPDWRGGARARVLASGIIAIGDEVRIEAA
jgi:MOSC domain-containing protein YiiM